MNRLPTDVRKEQIKRAVLKIISRDGLSSLSTRRLAREVGVSEGTLFRHFKSKQEMLTGIIEDVHDKLMTQLAEVAESDLPPSEKLLSFLCTHVKYLIANKGITILLFSEAAHLNDNELKAHIHHIMLKQKEFVGNIFTEGIRNGKWDPELDVDNIVMLYMGIPITLNIELVLNPDGVKTDNFCRRMLCLLERVLRKQ